MAIDWIISFPIIVSQADHLGKNHFWFENDAYEQCVLSREDLYLLSYVTRVFYTLF